MLVPRKRTTNHTHPAGTARAVAAALTAAAATVAVAACGSTQATGTSGSASSKAPSSSASPSGRSSLQASSGVCSSVPKLTALPVRRVNGLPQNHMKFVFPATSVVSDAAQVQIGARNLCALPQLTRGAVDCPMDNGVSYQLTFVEGRQRFTPVTAEASGCSIVKGLGQPRRAEPAISLWQDLGLAIGIPHAGENSFSGAQTSTGASS